MRRPWALLVVGLLAVAAERFKGNPGHQYLGSAPFGDPTENGMSYARKEAYEYEFDPEMYIGYNRQDNYRNGTSLGASGYYILVEDQVHIRIDQRDCKPTFWEGARVCFCYEVADKLFSSADCKGEPGFAPFCVEKDGGSTFLDGENKQQTIEKGLSFLISFNMLNKGNEENLVFFTDYLGDGLHNANPNHQEYMGTFKLTKSQYTLMKPKIIPMWLFGRMNLVDTIQIKFNGCARIDYFGLAYGGDLLSLDLKTTLFVDPPEPKTLSCMNCACT